jgi:hypothetical protein
LVVATSLAAFYLFVAPPLVRAGLPGTQQLIRETKKTCIQQQKEKGDNIDWPLMELAAAQAYALDYEGALQTARLMSGNAFMIPAFFTCWKIYFERTDRIAELPKDPPGDNDIEKGLHAGIRLEAAKVLIKAGENKAAAKFLPKDGDDLGRDRNAFFAEFYLALAEDQVQRGDREGADKSLQRSFASWKRFRYAVMHLDWVESMVKLWLQLGNREQAILAKEAALRLVQELSQNSKPVEYFGLNWAQIGKLYLLLNEDKLAREAFAEGHRLVEAADRRAKEENRGRNPNVERYIRTMGQIGTRQFVSGMKHEATASYTKAITKAEEIGDARGRDYELDNLVKLQCDAGDVEGALKTLEHIRGLYRKARGCCACAGGFVAVGQRSAAQRLLEKAAAFADADPENSCHIFLEIAKVKGKAEEQSAAKEYCDKALQLSRATKDNRHHQSIARCQVRVGLFEDAYETIMAIQEVKFRLLPLAELAHQAARKEALAQKKGATK